VHHFLFGIAVRDQPSAPSRYPPVLPSFLLVVVLILEIWLVREAGPFAFTLSPFA